MRIFLLLILRRLLDRFVTLFFVLVAITLGQFIVANPRGDWGTLNIVKQRQVPTYMIVALVPGPQ